MDTGMDLWISMGLDTQNFRDGLSSAEKDLTKYFDRIESIIKGEEVIIDEQGKYVGENIKKVSSELKKPIEIDFYAKLSDFEKDLDAKIKNAVESAEDSTHIRRLKRIQQQIEIGKMTGEHSAEYLYKKAEYALENAESIRADKLIKIERRKAEEIQKIEEDTQNRIKALTEDTADREFELTHTAFEKQLRDIEKWKEAQLEKSESAEEAAAIVANAAAKETEALEREVERIKGLTQSLEDEIFEMEHSRYESDKRRAMQKAQKAIDEGVDPELVQRWLTAKNSEIDKKARESMRSGGDYVQSPNGGKVGFFTEFFNKATQQQDALLTDENVIRARLINQMADESSLRELNNRQLSNSTNEMISAQTRLNNQIGKGITIIEGDQVRYGGGDLGGFDNIQTYVRSREEILRDLPEIQRGLEEGLRNGSIQKVDDTFYSAKDGYGSDLHNYIQSLEELGSTTREAFTKLDEINTSIRETAVEPTKNQQAPNITVSPNINVDLGGAYVFDDQMKNQLTDDITESVTNAITDTFNKEVRSTSYNYGN